MDKNDLLLKNDFFGMLSKSEQSKIADSMNMRTYPKDTFIFWQNEDVANCFIIEKGLVKLFRTCDNGRVRTIGLFKEYDILPVNSIFIMPIKHFTTAQALTNSVIYSVPINVISTISKSNNEFYNHLLKKIHNWIEKILLDFDNMVFGNIQGNLALKLVALSEKFGIRKSEGIQINLKMSQRELADMIGTNPETVCKSLIMFKEENSITIKNKMITITDREKLLKWK